MLDFTKLNRNYMTVVLDDGNDTKLRLMTPTKKLAAELDYVYSVKFAQEDIEAQYEALYDAATGILNRNKEGVEVKREDVEKCLDDIVDVWTLLNAYRQFIFEQMQAQAKN